MASETDICNRALQKIGEARITSIDENSPPARQCKRAFDIVRDAELRKYTWSFAIRRQTLAPSTSTPAHGFTYAFPVPSDFIRLHPDNEVDDWAIEAVEDSEGNLRRMILTNDGDTLKVRYIARIENTQLFDDLFVEVFATILAHEIAEPITNSTAKKRELKEEYRMLVRQARHVQAIEKVSSQPPQDEWVTARL